MDGVISDTQNIHAKIESELLQNYEIEIPPEEITQRYAGVAGEEMFPQIFENAGKQMPAITQLVKEKWQRMKESIEMGLQEVPGTRVFIELLKGRGLKLAVASASNKSFIELVLSELNLTEKFDVIASAEEVKRGKPEPDVFLLAAKRLSVLPENCIVIEDGLNGMIAAKRAGMRCIGLVRHDKNQDYPVDLLVKDLRDVPVDQFIVN